VPEYQHDFCLCPYFACAIWRQTTLLSRNESWWNLLQIFYVEILKQHSIAKQRYRPEQETKCKLTYSFLLTFSTGSNQPWTAPCSLSHNYPFCVVSMTTGSIHVYPAELFVLIVVFTPVLYIQRIIDPTGASLTYFIFDQTSFQFSFSVVSDKKALQ
jgi:hypothetical protein